MGLTLKPLGAATLRQQIAVNLREAIYRGDFHPGDAIPEAQVASQLGVSRAPVREAILLLEKEGLVTVHANRGAVIRSLSPTELLEIMSMRYRLETWALELARPRMTPGILASLERTYGSMVEAARRGDIRGFTNIDHSFHRAFWEAGGNALLAETLQRISGPVFAFADIALSQAGFDCTRLAELHKPILEYLAGTPEAEPGDVLRGVFDYAFRDEWDALFGKKK